MARDDLSRLRRSQCQSAGSWPKKARSLAKQRRRLVASLLIRQKDQIQKEQKSNLFWDKAQAMLLL